MHIYIYDSYVNEKRYSKTMARIETRITDLGLNGRIIRLGAIKSVYDMVENEVKKGAKTIVAVGNNGLLNQTINAVANLSIAGLIAGNMPIGFIPVGKKNNNIANYLGIDYEEAACDVLSARRIQKIDLGIVNKHYFLTQAVISTIGTSIEIDENYSLEITKPGEIIVINLPTEADFFDKVKSSAKDGKLELFINTEKAKRFLITNMGAVDQSVFSFQKIRIISKNHQAIIIDESIRISTPADISLAKEKINLITGKGVLF